MSKTPGSAGKKVNTLFNYFVKSPAGNVKSSKSCPKSETIQKSSQKLKLDFFAGDLVWAKLEGHPWWPCIVSNHPKEGILQKKEGNVCSIHVQFFENPPSRGWVKEKFVKPFNGSVNKECQRGGIYFSSTPKWRDAVLEADKALNLDLEGRLKLVVAMDSSGEEEEDEDCMEIEDLPSESSSHESGNKADKENKSPPSASPCKSHRKSGRKPETKRRRVIESDGDEVNCLSPEDCYKPERTLSSSEDDSEESLSCEDEDKDDHECNEVSDEGGESPKSKKRMRNGAMKSAKKGKNAEGVVRSKPVKIIKKSQTEVKCQSSETSSGTDGNEAMQSTKLKLSAYSSTSAKESSSSCAAAPLHGADDDRSFPHASFKFLYPDKIKDADGRLASDPDYDPRTLFVPNDFLSKQTPAMRQWWILKSQHFDTILFFKMGKFYELFHMDAVLGVSELGLLFMKGDHAHCGFPEISYGRFSDILVQKGHKVARVEQTETPDQMQERCKQSKSVSKFDKVVRREICSVQSRGTKKSSFIDGDCCSSDHNFLLAVAEKVDGSESLYGVCFVDVMIGTFHVGQFKDDRHGSRLRTLISHHPPSQVLYEKGKLSDKTKSIFNSCLDRAIKEGLRSVHEFWDGHKTLKILSEADYFMEEDQSGVKWPLVFEEMVSKEDTLGVTPSDEFVLGLSALGAVLWYLRHCLMDDELLSLRSFDIYKPVDMNSTPQPDQVPCKTKTANRRMILDGVTLKNLDVVVNNCTGTSEGTLLQRLDSCKTSFGKRLFKQWLCSPLCNVESINDRLDAMEDIMSIPDVVSQVSSLLSKMPDLERLINKIHTLGSLRRSKNHPDGRAVFFEDVVYNKRKIEDFLTCLEGFKSAKAVLDNFAVVAESLKSELLKKCVTLKEFGGNFPDLTKHLEFFEASFDHQKAKAMGVIKPVKGVSAQYDSAVNDIKFFEGELNDSLEKLKKMLNCKTLTYFGTAKNRYQAEIPESLSRKIPDEYELTSQRKGFKRYQSPEIKKLFGKLVDAEDRRSAAQKDTMRCIFEQFDKHHATWTEALHCLSVLDILMSLAAYSNQSGLTMCRPVLVSNGDNAFLEIRNGCHPCIEQNISGTDFIPNDTIIGVSNDDLSSARVLLVTGPNMGGKSTLMRQVGLICLLAQLGCYVPAEKCRLTPVDRIFTRLGASDSIMSGESTFFVELSETSCVLKHATRDSLVLLDELGRGTATYDGNAIATAVLHELANSVQCRAIFSTHYHSIVDKFSSNPHVSLGHMACMVENEDDEDPCQETITFLFKLARGNCPKSYGFNAAKLAGIPSQVIREAHSKAKEFEESTRVIQLFRNLWSLKEGETKNLKLLIEQIR